MNAKKGKRITMQIAIIVTFSHANKIEIVFVNCNLRGFLSDTDSQATDELGPMALTASHTYPPASFSETFVRTMLVNT